uniref:dolichyl-diphosphooligosaccharide--protein glycotransferase n=1 Tax=Aegilops tauschii subsp. strangulata TaxID=200361 RepID=A0A453DFK1_AEGTS
FSLGNTWPPWESSSCCRVFFFLDWVKYMLNDVKLFKSFLRITLTCVISVGTLALGIGTASGYISPWTGRFYSLLDPTYAKDHIPIIASVSEHQPTAWSSFMFDFHILLFLFPAGLYFCFKRLSDATIFIVMYGLTSMYFAGVMVRLILVAAPAVCLISAIAVSATIKNLTTLIRSKSKSPQTTGKTTGSKAAAKREQLINPCLSNIMWLLLYFWALSTCSVDMPYTALG